MVVLLVGISGKALGQDDPPAPVLDEIVPPDGASIPLNGHVFFRISEQDVGSSQVTVLQAGVESVLSVVPFNCGGGCFFDVALSESGIGPGSISLIVASDLPSSRRVEYDVSSEQDDEPPRIDAPRVFVEERRLPWPTYQLLWHRIEVRERPGFDNTGIAAIIYEADTEADHAGEDGFAPISLDLGQSAIDSAITVARPPQATACARLTGIDWAGNKTTSETRCVELEPEPPEVSLPFGCQFRGQGPLPVECPGYCACVAARTDPAIASLLALVLLGVLALGARKKHGIRQ